MDHSTNPADRDNTPEIEESLRHGAAEACYGVTILETVPWPLGGMPLLTKTITQGADGEPVVDPYGRAKWFKFHVRECASIEALLAMLKQLERYPHCCIVRGAPVDGLDLTRPHRRLLNAQSDGSPATLRDVGRAWIAFDVDGASEVPGIDWRVLPREALAAAWKRDAPDWCRDVYFVAYFTSSQGFKPGLRYRVFLFLDRPLSSAAAKACIKAENELRKGAGRGSFDLALYSPGEPHYTAAPVFGDGIADPLPAGRVFLLKGTCRRATPPDEAVERVYSGGGVHGGGGVGANKGRSSVGQRTTVSLRPVLCEADSLARGGEASAYSPRINGFLAPIERGEGSFHEPICSALAVWVGENGGWADPFPIMRRVLRLLEKYAAPRNGQSYVNKQARDFAVAIDEWQARERQRTEAEAGSRDSAGANTPLAGDLKNKERRFQ